jgi:transcriptional regulator with XRE-family HTH domain
MTDAAEDGLRSIRNKAAVPGWAQKIEEFRHHMNLSQSEFARRLGSSPMAVSRWERGIQKVPANIYIRLGILAGDPLCWYFWGLTGLRTEDVMRVLPEARQRLNENRIAKVVVVHADSQDNSLAKETDFVAVPFLPVRAGTPGNAGNQRIDLEQVQPESMWAAPKDWCPNPSSTVCFRVKGNSMSPLILDGYIIAVDTSEIDREHLLGKIVVAYNEKKGLVVSRLTRFDHTDALISDQREYGSISLGLEFGWRIFGKVLWWTGQAR